MTLYEYRILPAPRRPKRVKGAKTSAERFAHMLTEVMNAQAAEGWEYLRADTLPMDEKRGMLSSSTTEAYQSVLIFRREKVSPAAAVHDLHEIKPRDETEPKPRISLGPAARVED